MSTRQETYLLVDLAKLLKKYGPEPFEALASSIATPEMSQRLANLLTHAARTAQATSKEREEVKAKKRSKPVRDLLLSLKTSEPEKYELLIRFYDDMMSGKFLPSMRDIRNFVSECGLPEIRQPSRQKSIDPLIKALILLPIEELNRKIQSVMKYSRPKSDLEGWSNLILAGTKKGHKE